MRKYLAFGLAGALALSALTGCSKSEKPDTAVTDGSQTSSGETSAEASGNGDKKEKFLIGGFGPLTGGAASYGLSVKQGAEIAIKEINEAGGVVVGDTTYELALDFLDDEAKEDTAVVAINTLLDKKVNALLGSVTSGAGIAINEISNEAGLLQITPSGSAVGCIEYPNQFRLCFTDPLQGITLADYVKESLGLTKVAVIYNNSDEYSTGAMEAFVQQAEKNGIEVVASEAFNEGDVDFKTQLTTIKGTDAQAVVAPIYYEAASYILTQAADIGLDLPFLGSDGWDGVLAQLTDPSVAEGAIFLSPFLVSDPAVKSFVDAYEAAYKALPDQFAADGYDVVYVMKAAMEKAGSIESEALIKAMTEIEVKGLTGDVSFTEDGEPNKGAKFVKISGGEYIANE